MATINYTLKIISNDLFIKYKSKERAYIDEKIVNFQTALKSCFGDKISDVLLFGSYKRDTILPRRFDEKSDIDVLIIFNQSEKKFNTETYRNQIKQFAKIKYPRTPVVKDHPSVVLELQKIKFDLVPCRIYSGLLSDYYQIPDKNGYWMDTYPREFNKKLTNVNNQSGSIVKPLIRLFKCWNANQNYPFSSYELENIIADMSLSNKNLQSGFIYIIDNLPTNSLSQLGKQKIETLRNNGRWIKEYLNRDNQEKAKEVVCRILGVKI